jgi:hypothetical protein
LDLTIAARPHTPTTFLPIMCVEQEIKTHTRRVESGELVFYGQACPGCGGQEGFRLHDRRRRTYRIVVQGCVKLLCSWILRWRCLACGKRFTDCPPFCGSAQAVRQAACAGQGQAISGYKHIVSQGGPARGDTHPVRRSANKRDPGRPGSCSRVGGQHRLAVDVVAGEPEEHPAGSLAVDPTESAQQRAASRTVAAACPETWLRWPSPDTSAGRAMPGHRALVPGTVRPGNIPQLCNGSRLALS